MKNKFLATDNILYSINKHPLSEIKRKEKLKYISLLEDCVKTTSRENNFVLERLKQLKNIFIGEISSEDLEIYQDNNISKKVLKRRFTFFKFYTYSYVFLFDFLLLVIPENLEEANETFEKIKLIFPKNYHSNLNDFISMLYGEKIMIKIKNSFIEEEFLENWNNIRFYLNSEEKNIIFTSTMSAGKSALINAIAGKEISYSLALACTSNILNFYTTPNKTKFFHFFTKTKNYFYQNIEDIDSFIKDSKESFDLITSFDSELSKYKLHFIDTPGVDNSLDEKHRTIAEKRLSKKDIDILVYIIPVVNYQALGIHEHLTWIFKNAKYKKILFVLNMMDICNPKKDNIPKILETVEKNLENIGYKNPIVCPLSSKYALFLKELISKKELLGREEARELEKTSYILKKEEMHLNKYYLNYDEKEEKKESNEISKLLLFTGIKNLEKILLKFIKESI